MTPQDLRIGNRVLYYDKEVTVLELTERLCRISHHDGYTWYHNIKPIPLTPEILERCGFVTTDGLNWNFYLDNDTMAEPHTRRHLSWHLNLRELELDMNRLCFFRLYDPSLHQLQNLTFALTGKELEIK